MVKKLKKYFSKETIIFIAITLLFYILWGTVSLFCDKNNSLTNSGHPIYAVIMNLFHIPFTNAYAATWVQFLVFMFLIFVTTLVFGIILIYLLKNHKITFLGSDCHHDGDFKIKKLKKKLKSILKNDNMVEDVLKNNFDKVILNENFSIKR